MEIMERSSYLTDDLRVVLQDLWVRGWDSLLIDTGIMFHQNLRTGGVLMPSGTNDSKLDATVLELANEPNYAAFTTLLPSGHPQTQMMWVDTDGQHVRINTEVHRQKFKNVERDPRVTVMIRDENNPFRYAEVRGEVVEKVRGPEAREHIDELSRKYMGGPYQNPIQSERVMLRIAPLRQFIFA